MVTTARERARAELTREITDAARAQLATVGAAALSLRAVARELGLASSALYRYFPSRDELLTRLIIEGYDALGAAAEAADDPAAAPRDRWLAICRAVRAWAQAHPHEYALLYGSPVPGYAAPSDTVAAAVRVAVLLGRVIRAADRPPPQGTLRGVVDPAVAEVLGTEPTVDETGLARALLAWSSVYGAVSFELFGHLTGSLLDADAWFDEATGALGELVGL